MDEDGVKKASLKAVVCAEKARCANNDVEVESITDRVEPANTLKPLSDGDIVFDEIDDITQD